MGYSIGCSIGYSIGYSIDDDRIFSDLIPILFLELKSSQTEDEVGEEQQYLIHSTGAEEKL